MNSPERQHRSNTHPHARATLSKHVALRVSHELYERAVQAASVDRRDISDFIRIAVEDRIATMEHAPLQRHRRGAGA